MPDFFLSKLWNADRDDSPPAWFWVLLLIALPAVLLWLWVQRLNEEMARMEAQPASRAAATNLTVEERIPYQPPKTAKPPAPDNLKLIEGIGPKVEKLFGEAGITTYRDLAGADVDRLREILQDANLYMLNPQSWPEQARLAADGRWDELEEMKSTLRAGRRTS